MRYLLVLLLLTACNEGQKDMALVNEKYTQCLTRNLELFPGINPYQFERACYYAAWQSTPLRNTQ